MRFSKHPRRIIGNYAQDSERNAQGIENELLSSIREETKEICVFLREPEGWQENWINLSEKVLQRGFSHLGVLSNRICLIKGENFLLWTENRGYVVVTYLIRRENYEIDFMIMDFVLSPHVKEKQGGFKRRKCFFYDRWKRSEKIKRWKNYPVFVDIPFHYYE